MHAHEIIVKYTCLVGLGKVNNEIIWLKSGARFLKALETFWAHKAICSSSVSKRRELYTPESSCKKGTSVHIFKNMWTKQLCNRKVWDFAMAFNRPKKFLGLLRNGCQATKYIWSGFVSVVVKIKGFLCEQLICRYMYLQRQVCFTGCRLRVEMSWNLIITGKPLAP